MFRIGFGSDIHRLVEGRKLILGGVEVPFVKGADAHSDGDVLLHALTDALLGALALGDIGQHFPNTEARWKDKSSAHFVAEAFRLVQTKGWQLANIDATITCEQPKLKDFLSPMRANVAELLQTDKDNISIKAGTNEQCDAVGRCEAISAQVMVLLKKIK